MDSGMKPATAPAGNLTEGYTGLITTTGSKTPGLIASASFDIAFDFSAGSSFSYHLAPRHRLLL